MIANNILETIGNTPHIKMQRLFGDAHVWIKSERANPGGSIKDRIGLAMIEAAEKSGALKPGGTIIEPTSGNTGVGLAMVAAVKGYTLVLVMPESMSLERRRLMLAYGATFDLSPKEKGMKGAIERAQELVDQTPGSWMPQQFENPANFEVHKRTTAIEILNDFKDNPLDAIITGVGTGGHITGVAEVLKEHWNHLKVYAVEPTSSPVISGGQPPPVPRWQPLPRNCPNWATGRRSLASTMTPANAICPCPSSCPKNEFHRGPAVHVSARRCGIGWLSCPTQPLSARRDPDRADHRRPDPADV